MSQGEVIYTDKIGMILWYPEYKAILHTYHKGNDFATDEEFLEHIQNMTDKIEEYKPVGMIEDYAKLEYIASPEVQAKIAAIVKPVLVKIGLKRYAKLVSEGDLVAELQAEQMVDQARKVSKTVIPDMVFTDLQEALEWVKTAL